ncbi:MAG: M48 family metallopeptidase [Bacteroidales bacterium]|nr:M48 family metallopeptidase [Bacteroidales bacterium]
MRTSIIRDLAILLVIFGCIWGIISFFPLFPEKVELLSIEKEQKLGETYLEILMKSADFREVESEEVQSAVESIGLRLENALEDSEYTYNYVVVEDEMINAFTLPGANILVTTGLIGFSGSAEELAAVIAHEMAHVEMRHVVTRLAKELGISVLTSGDQFVVGELTRIMASTGFDRGQEQDADEFACALLEDAQIEPRTLAVFFRKLKEEQDNTLLEKFEIVSTHPNFTSRIRYVLEYVPGEDFEAVPLEMEWEGVQDQLQNQEESE